MFMKALFIISETLKTKCTSTVKWKNSCNRILYSIKKVHTPATYNNMDQSQRTDIEQKKPGTYTPKTCSMIPFI